MILALDECFTPSWYYQASAHSSFSKKVEVLIDLDCRYTQKFYEAAFASTQSRTNKWRIVKRRRHGGYYPNASTNEGGEDQEERPDRFDLRVEEYETIPWETIMAPDSRTGASSFCVRKGLGRKAVMAETLSTHRVKCGVTCPLVTALPETIVIDTTSVFLQRPSWLDFKSAFAECISDAEEAIDSIGEGALWVLKPSITNKAEGLSVVGSIEEVREALLDLPEMGTWVLQRYIDRPLLLLPTRNKFHLRIYVLASGSLTVNVYREGLVLIAAAPYNRESARDKNERASHITNTCVGVSDGYELFDENIHVRSMEELSGLLLESKAVASMKEAEFRVNQIWESIFDIVDHSFRALEGRVGLYMPLPFPSFELYGVDFLVDDAFRVSLLEFNPSPDVKQTGKRLDGIIARLLDGVVGLATEDWDGRGFQRVYQKDWPHGKMSIKVT
jgi:hypothetical protein